MDIKFNIEETCDQEHYVVQVNYTGVEDGWVDITNPFDNFQDALDWALSIKDNFSVQVPVPF